MSASIHRSAAVGFGVGADAYERGRPDYPPEAVAWLVDALAIGPGARVVDLAAGTGKLTRMLAATGASIVAVEPVAAMRERLVATVPGVDAVDGTAEAIPLGGGSVDAVTVAQAFHWFDAGRAVVEIARVLRPGGGLGLIWNIRDESVPWVAGLTRIMEPHRGDTPTHRGGAWRAPFDEGDRFAPLVERTFRYTQRLSRDGVVDRVLSVSFIAALPGAERDRVVNEVRELLDGDAETAGRDVIDLPYRTDVYRSTTGPGGPQTSAINA